MAVFSTPRRAMAVFLSVLLLVQFTVAGQHNARHQQHAQRFDHLRARQAQGFISITGPTDGQQHVRLEMREMMATNPDQWNLLVLAMETFKAMPKEDPMSYYQIAGIHGRPFIPWNEPGPLLHQAGYCPHGQSLFGSWHRPYLALFEQALYDNAQKIVDSFPADQQQRWTDALVGFRMPYWDWAADPDPVEGTTTFNDVPDAILDDTVTVIKPEGNVTIPNPLASYTFGDRLPPEFGRGPANYAPKTLRQPGQPSSAVYESNIPAVREEFRKKRVNWRQRVFALFATKQPFQFASTSQYGIRTTESVNMPQSNYLDSFEAVHDEVHSTMGGSEGHMSWLDYAAYDPFFWFHHVNVDRLLAMLEWTSDSYDVAGVINRNMAQWTVNETKNINTPLVPFTNTAQGAFWSSATVKETRVLGYYYKETATRDRATVLAAINDLYSGRRSGVGTVFAPIGKRQAAPAANLDVTAYEGRPFQTGDYNTVVHVVGDKYAVSGSYSVQCYLKTAKSSKSAPTNGSNAIFEEGYVGSHSFLGGTMATGNSTPILTQGTVPLTSALQACLANGEIESLKPDVVEKFLNDTLVIKVVGPDGVMEPGSLPELHINVYSTPVTPATKDDELPTYGDYAPLPEVELPYSPPPPPPVYPMQPTPSTGDVSTASTSGTLPWDEPGYCEVHQTVIYVDETGKEIEHKEL